MTQTQRLDVRELIIRNPLSRFQKQIIFLGFCVIALDGFDIAIMGFIAPTLKLEWGVSNHQLGLVISAALIGLALVLLAGTLWGFLETFGIAPHVPAWWVVPVWAIGLGLGQMIMTSADRRADRT